MVLGSEGALPRKLIKIFQAIVTLRDLSHKLVPRDVKVPEEPRVSE